MVRGYYVYKEVWCAAVGEELSCVREVENYRDLFAVLRIAVHFEYALSVRVRAYTKRVMRAYARPLS